MSRLGPQVFRGLDRAAATARRGRCAAGKGIVNDAVHLKTRRRERPARHGNVVPVATVREFLAVAPGDCQNATLATGTITDGQVGFMVGVRLGGASGQKRRSAEYCQRRAEQFGPGHSKRAYGLALLLGRV